MRDEEGTDLSETIENALGIDNLGSRAAYQDMSAYIDALDDRHLNGIKRTSLGWNQRSFRRLPTRRSRAGTGAGGWVMHRKTPHGHRTRTTEHQAYERRRLEDDTTKPPTVAGGLSEWALLGSNQ